VTERKLAGAPITWGVSEVPGWGLQLDRERVLSEIARAGFRATELGPPGFLPADPAGIRACLSAHGLELVGGFVTAVLHRTELQDAQLGALDASARTLAGAGAKVLVLATAAGTEGYESPHRLDDSQWDALRRGISSADEIGRARGLVVALHPHYGTLIENAEQIDRIMTTTGVSLCLDTGHLTVADVDPLAIARAADGRVAHVHLKDVDAGIAARLRAGEIGYRDAVRAGLYRPLGDGDVDLEPLLGRLDASGYSGWYVVEEDAVIDAEREGTVPLDHAIRSLRYLEEVLSP
jgi:inosose dehydratase